MIRICFTATEGGKQTKAYVTGERPQGLAVDVAQPVISSTRKKKLFGYSRKVNTGTQLTIAPPEKRQTCAFFYTAP